MPIYHKACLPLVRLHEPCFMEKAKHRFDCPVGHMAPRYKEIGLEIQESLDHEDITKLTVKKIDYPDLEYFKTFGQNTTFSSFNAKHVEYASALIKIFHDCKDLEELISMGLYIRDQINRHLFAYAFYVVLTHRYDTDNIILPQYFEIAPNSFFKKDIFSQIAKTNYISLSEPGQRRRRQANSAQKPPIVIPFHNTMNVANPEEKMTYFREDIALNSHHYHWHIVYPMGGPYPEYYNKDRRGELFYYMHHQMLNTYDLNRLAQRIAPLRPLDNFREIIVEGYFSNMTTNTSSYNIPPRQDYTCMHDLSDVKVNDLERWYNRLMEAIDNGACVDTSGNKIPLNNNAGIDVFCNLIESNQLSKNPGFYGNLHNTGHIIISQIHDPMIKHKEAAGCLSDTSTSCRDPVFFRWHKMVDNLCVKLKNRLPPYQNKDLAFNGIAIQKLDILNASTNKPVDRDELNTFWQISTINLEYGLDFHVNQPVLVQTTHLNYRQYKYSITVQNSNAAAMKGTVRIFLCPVYDERGQKYPFNGFRPMAVEIDRFTTNIAPGVNRIERKSSESSLTIGFDRTFPLQLDNSYKFSSDMDPEVQAYCMCGWPQHMMIPKGSENGYPYYCFVMISDYNVDKVDQAASNGVCIDNYILCGIAERKYPDTRSMGFPFDRPFPAASSMEDFVRGRPNMISKQITVRHIGENTAQVGDNPDNVVQI